MNLFDLALLFVEAFVVATLVIGLFQARSRIGLSPLFVALGTFQFLQVVLSSSVYVEVWPGMAVSPGSTVLFPGSLLAVLLVYIREDARATRQLIYGLVFANLALTILLRLVALHPTTETALAFPPELIGASAVVLLSGTLFLWLDVILLILGFELVSRVRSPLPARVFVTLTAVLAIDSVLFLSINLGREPDFPALLVAMVVGKTTAAAFYSIVLALYLRATTSDRRQVGTTDLGDLFDLLTYRQRFEALREHVARDALTGAYNRLYFDEQVVTEIDRARRSGQPLSLLMLDVDRFKAVNDAFGHQEGDRALVMLCGAADDTVRENDAVCRYGGEEFCVLLPGASAAVARLIAERIRRRLAALVSAAGIAGGHLTVTIGVATFPLDAADATGLVETADRRMYAGKSAGRDRVVASSRLVSERASG